jgi:hypothetical protein
MAQWWVIAASTLNGKPFDAVSFEGDRTQAQNAGRGIIAGPFGSDAQAVTFGNAWSAKNKRPFTDKPGVFPPVAQKLAHDVNPKNWLSSMGGSIASGIESGFVTFLKDIWKVIVGPVEILAGIFLAGFILVYAAKDDLMKLLPLIAK